MAVHRFAGRPEYVRPLTQSGYCVALLHPQLTTTVAMIRKFHVVPHGVVTRRGGQDRVGGQGLGKVAVSGR